MVWPPFSLHTEDPHDALTWSPEVCCVPSNCESQLFHLWSANPQPSADDPAIYHKNLQQMVTQTFNSTDGQTAFFILF